MKGNFEIPVAEGHGRESVVRVNISAAVLGGAAASLGNIYLARQKMLPEALTQEVLGDVDKSTIKVTDSIRVDEKGQAEVASLSLIRSNVENQLHTFVMPLNQEDLAQSANEVHEKVTSYLAEHPIKPGNSTRIELEVFNETFGADPFQQIQFISETKGTKTLNGQERVYNGNSFEAYLYYPKIATGTANALKIAENLDGLVQSRFASGTVEKVGVAGNNKQALPFTVRQYERLAQLAQDNGYGNVEEFLDEHYYENTEAHDQIQAAMREFNILVDQPSVLVKVIEEFPAEHSVDIKGCRLEIASVKESYHYKEYAPGPLPLGFITALGVVAAGIRYRQQRKLLDSERLRKLGLDGPAPDKEAFEAVRDGTASTRQKLVVLRYQKAAELVDDKGKHLNIKRLCLTGCGVALAGLMGAVGVLAFGGDKADEKLAEKPRIHIAKESDYYCLGSDMIAIEKAEKGPTKSVHYFTDENEPEVTPKGTRK